MGGGGGGGGGAWASTAVTPAVCLVSQGRLPPSPPIAPLKARQSMSHAFSSQPFSTLAPCHCPFLLWEIAALAAFYAETEPMGNTAGTVSANIYLGHGMGSVWFVVALFAVALSLQLCCPLEYQPPGWHVPWWLMPWLPTVAIGLMVFRYCTV